MRELTRDCARALLPGRAEDSNKATFGSVLNVAGSLNYRGAACLSSLAALKTGAGYSTLACIRAVADSAASLTPDIVTFPLNARNGGIGRNEYKKLLTVFPKYTVLAIGCGLFSAAGDNGGVHSFFRNYLEAIAGTDKPVIIDADGLNILAEQWPVRLPKRLILTPHPKELSRLLKTGVEEIQRDRTAHAVAAAKKFRATVVLKGHRTVITDGEATFVNATGNSALAKAGTGDVLTGMTAGFCAQGLMPMDAACLAVYLHGLAGELASGELTEYGVLASDLIDFIPRAIGTLAREPS